jgi:sterol desaturase/sphingolipid hydroxylase (fatty acid hydroxylase superfamily)
MMPDTVAVQIAIYALIITSLLVAEHVVSATPPGEKIKHLSLNSLFIFAVLPIQIPMSVLCLALAAWSVASGSGLVHFLPYADSPWIKYGLMFVFLDLIDYLYHFTMHRVRFFWRFHAVHHSDLAVDVSTTFREHPGETFLRNVYLITWVFIVGASPEILIVRQTTQSFFNLFSHASFRLPTGLAGVVSWVFITPNLHHVHHHYRLPLTNSNYGDVFSIWDRVFGTLSTPARERPHYGLDTHMSYVRAASFWQTLLIPFLPGLNGPARAPDAIPVESGQTAALVTHPLPSTTSATLARPRS